MCSRPACSRFRRPREHYFVDAVSAVRERALAPRNLLTAPKSPECRERVTDPAHIEINDCISYIDGARETSPEHGPATGKGRGGNVEDLNDFFIFSQVVEHNGFTGAARALGVARSSSCRRVGQLEERLGVRLVQRSTRHFVVTDLGMQLHGHCVKMVAEATAAYERVACARATPSGLIRLSCPPIVAQLLVSPLLPESTEKNPEVRIPIEATDRRAEPEQNF